MFLLSSLTLSQIWLITLVDNCQSTYLRKLKKKEKKNQPQLQNSKKAITTGHKPWYGIFLNP